MSLQSTEAIPPPFREKPPRVTVPSDLWFIALRGLFLRRADQRPSQHFISPTPANKDAPLEAFPGRFNLPPGIKRSYPLLFTTPLDLCIYSAILDDDPGLEDYFFTICAREVYCQGWKLDNRVWRNVSVTTWPLEDTFSAVSGLQNEVFLKNVNHIFTREKLTKECTGNIQKICLINKYSFSKVHDKHSTR